MASRSSFDISKIALWVLVGLFGLLIASLCYLQFSTSNIKPTYGISFSAKYARALGIDPHQSLKELLSEVHPQKVRLMSYWDEIEPEQGKYNFTELDQQFSIAKENNTKVSLSIGLRQPRWPECHEPGWAKSLAKEHWQMSLHNYLRTTIERYRNHPNLESWQLENEALNTQFGLCDSQSKQNLDKEFELLKQTDPNHKVIMTLSNQYGLPLRQPQPDAYGLSIYRVFYNKLLYHGYITYPTPLWYHRLRALIIEQLGNKPVIIHELQLEPWGPRSVPEMSLNEQDKSMSPERMQKNLQFGAKVGVQDIYLWGAEWWYWRKKVMGDTKPWDIAKAELHKKVY